jgi:Na+/melibiose symporter-like transporter
MDSPGPGRRWLPVRPGATMTGPQDARPPAGGRRVMSNGAAITLIAVGAILRFALAPGSPHGLNIHVAGVVLILAGALGLLLSLLLRPGPREQRSLVRHTRGEYYRQPRMRRSRSRLTSVQQDAAADVARVRQNDQFFGPDDDQ